MTANEVFEKLKANKKYFQLAQQRARCSKIIMIVNLSKEMDKIDSELHSLFFLLTIDEYKKLESLLKVS